MTTPPGKPRQSKYAERLKTAISRYTPADREALLDFCRAMYGESSIGADLSYLDWLYGGLAGPDAPLWLYRSEGRVEGQIGAIRVTLRTNETTRPAMWATNLMVTQRLRARGIGPMMGRVAFQDNDVLLGVEVTNAARASFLREGWVDAGTVPIYVRPLHVESMLRIRAGVSVHPLLLGATERGLAVADHILRWASLGTGLRCEDVPAFDERAARVWETMAASISVAVERDLAYLTWRYNNYPKPGRYRIHYFLRGGSLRAWVVTRTGALQGLHAGFIVDFAGSRRDLACAFAQLLVRFRREGAAAVYCLEASPAYAAVLQALGFLKRDSTWNLMARAPAGEDALRALLANQANWFVTFGDSDADRPREGTIYAPEPTDGGARAGGPGAPDGRP